MVAGCGRASQRSCLLCPRSEPTGGCLLLANNGDPCQCEHWHRPSGGKGIATSVQSGTLSAGSQASAVAVAGSVRRSLLTVRRTHSDAAKRPGDEQPPDTIWRASAHLLFSDTGWASLGGVPGSPPRAVSAAADGPSSGGEGGRAWGRV